MKIANTKASVVPRRGGKTETGSHKANCMPQFLALNASCKAKPCCNVRIWKNTYTAAQISSALHSRNGPVSLILTALFAFLVSSGLAWWFEWLSFHERQSLNLPLPTPRARRLRRIVVVIASALLFVLFHWASIENGCLETPEVQPSGTGRTLRLVFHLTLLAFLVVATSIDFDCYMIPDWITLPGTLIGLLGATLIGEAQICHLWVDWTVSIPQLRGPYIPAWYDAHRHWHGLAWSLAGMITGAGLTWSARKVSSLVLGQEAMGTGDITLMAMIGSYLGWQATTLVFLLAPLLGLTVGVVIRTVSGKTYLPYGPWLSLGAAVVLFSWSFFWGQTRMIFSDWLSIVTLGGVGSIGFVTLLALVQLYKSIPARGRST